MDMFEMKRIEPRFLGKAKKGGYVCPACGNGSGSDGTGITCRKGDTSYHCFVCGLHGDVIDLYGVYAGITDAAEKIRGFREYFGIEPDKPIGNSIHNSKICEQKKEDKKMSDFTKYYNEMMVNNDGRYLAKRGISKATQDHFRVGYDSNWRSPSAMKKMTAEGKNPDNIPASPRVIIPRSRVNYLARDTRPEKEVPENQRIYMKQNEGNVTLFNKNALQSDTVFVTEGEIDAMSVYEAGGAAIALCSTSNVKAFLDCVASKKRDGQLFVPMMDNDDPGRKAQQDLAQGLKDLQMNCITARYKYKDPNDYLVCEPNGFKRMIAKYLSIDPAVQYLPNNGKGLDYYRNIEDQPETFEAKTGFAAFDNEEENMCGGLHDGLHVLGAIMSIGKTTLSLQLADQIAERGVPVLYFPVEQTAKELQAKSISRETFKLYGGKKVEGRRLAKTYQQIMNNRRYAYYTTDEKEAIQNAIDRYEEYAWNVHIIDGEYQGGYQIDMNYITGIVDEFVKRSRVKPVVFIDYLQILSPIDPRMNDKQGVDASAKKMKNLAMKHHIPVFVISSFNRQSYSEPVDVTSFKESGGIEYFADSLYAMQYVGMDDKEDDDKGYAKYVRDLIKENKEKQKRGESVDVQFKCLKQRGGSPVFDAIFKFTAAYNFFEDQTYTENFCDVGETVFDNQKNPNAL
ncbi:MAG: toprim domain-containing protein [Clostridiales bacterium]|nr:toprim domain-containing protein [Clostridiales bacterium]